jgi:hypothetical protein
MHIYSFNISDRFHFENVGIAVMDISSTDASPLFGIPVEMRMQHANGYLSADTLVAEYTQQMRVSCDIHRGDWVRILSQPTPLAFGCVCNLTDGHLCHRTILMDILQKFSLAMSRNVQINMPYPDPDVYLPMDVPPV